jgi:hypothetical protein
MDTLHHRLIGQQALVGPTLTGDLFRLHDTCADASVDGKLQSPTGATVPLLLEATPVVTSGAFAQ